jgi:hypothetical protein
MQLLPLGKPDPAPKRRYIKKKTHGKADARGLTGAELADRALVIEEERAAKQVRTTTPDYSDGEGLLLIPDTPPRQQQQPWESQGGTSIVIGLPIRTPERARAGLPRALSLLPSPDPLQLPSSTAPARLPGRGARKRRHTDKYEDAVAGGDIDVSQHGAIGR